MIKCRRCKKEKPRSEFSKNKSKKNGLGSYCLACHRKLARDWYEKNKQYKRRDSIKRQAVKRERARKFVLKNLTECVDCGETNKVVLEFDHVTGKKVAGISYMTSNGYKIEEIEKEIAKCEVVCANCHRIRTAKRNKKHWTHQKRYKDLIS